MRNWLSSAGNLKPVLCLSLTLTVLSILPIVASADPYPPPASKKSAWWHVGKYFHNPFSHQSFRAPKPDAEKEAMTQRTLQKQQQKTTFSETPLPIRTAIPTPQPPVQQEKQMAVPQQEILQKTSPEAANTEEAVSTRTTDTKPVLSERHVLIRTQRGDILVELYPEAAPVTVKNFLKLVNEQFYDQPGMKFHRVVPGFVVQTGDPTGTGMGGAPETIPLEAKNKLSHNAPGIVAMARSMDPNSASSQFYITLTPQTALDGKYAIFGRVTQGLDVLKAIQPNDRLFAVERAPVEALAKKFNKVDKPVNSVGASTQPFTPSRSNKPARQTAKRSGFMDWLNPLKLFSSN